MCRLHPGRKHPGWPRAGGAGRVFAMASPQTVVPDWAKPGPKSRSRTLLKVLLGIACVLMVVMWLGIFTDYFAKTAPGTLDDKAFPAAAQPICTTAKTKLDGLKKAFETTNHVDRANEVAKSNVILRDLLDQLHAIAPTADRDGKMTQEWLGDWSTYVSNREDYVNRLRVDEKARFLESPKSSATEQISKPIDRFAYVNKMDQCDTPKDMS